MNRVMTGYGFGGHAARRQQAFTKSDFLKARFAFKLLVLVAFIVFLSLFYIWSRVQIVQTGYRINALKNERVELANGSKRFKVELSVLRSPQRLERIAGEKLGMILPGRERIVGIGD